MEEWIHLALQLYALRLEELNDESFSIASVNRKILLNSIEPIPMDIQNRAKKMLKEKYAELEKKKEKRDENDDENDDGQGGVVSF